MPGRYQEGAQGVHELVVDVVPEVPLPVGGAVREDGAEVYELDLREAPDRVRVEDVHLSLVQAGVVEPEPEVLHDPEVAVHDREAHEPGDDARDPGGSPSTASSQRVLCLVRTRSLARMKSEYARPVPISALISKLANFGS